MKVIPTGRTFASELDTLHEHFKEHDFFYIHYKPADAAGEDGNFEAKVRALEELDSYIPRLRDLGPRRARRCRRPLHAGGHGCA